MPEDKLQNIADEADFIIAGYAYTAGKDGKIRVLNLENPNAAAVLDRKGDMIETSMDDTELALVVSYFLRNAEFLEGDVRGLH